MCEMLVAVFNLVWDNEYAPSYWREGLIFCLRKGIEKTMVIRQVQLFRMW